MSLQAYNIDVPITPGSMPPVIHIGQYDTGRTYICHLKKEDGTDYTLNSGMTATFTGCNPRKEVFELDATVDTGANTVTISPEGAATSMWGRYGATLNLFLSDERMSPITIIMDVQKAGATDDEIAAAPDFPDAVKSAVDEYLAQDFNHVYARANRELAEYNATNLLPNGTDGSHRGVDFTWSTTKCECAAEGATTTYAATNYLLGTSSAPAILPVGMDTETPYTLTVTADAGLSLVIGLYEGTTQKSNTTYTTGTYTVTLGENIDGIKAYIYVPPGTSVDGKISMSLLNTKTNQELAEDVDGLGANVTALETAQATISENTANLFDPSGIQYGVGYTGSSAAYRAMGPAILVPASGISIISGYVPAGIQFKLDFYSTSALNGETPARPSNSWATSVKTETTDYTGKYFRFEFDKADGTELKPADMAGIELSVVAGTAPVPYLPRITAVDYVARARLTPHKDMTLCTWNTGLARFGIPSHVLHPDAIQFLQDMCNQICAQIVCFQEVTKDFGQAEGVTRWDLLRPFYPYIQKEITAETAASARAVMSRLPFLESGVITLDAGDAGHGNRKIPWADIDIGGKVLRVYCIHLPSGEDNPAEGKYPLTERRVELAEFASIMEANYAAGITAIGMGDYNFLGSALAEEMAILTDAGLVQLNGAAYGTYLTNSANPIDNAFGTPDLAYYGLKMLDARTSEFSDHNPLVFRLEVEV